MAKFHISENGEPAVCTAKIKCRLGGESGTENHFDTAEETREAFEKKMEDKGVDTIASSKRNINFNKTSKMDRLSNGRYEIPAGEYYVVCSESLEYPAEDDSVRMALENPSLGEDNRPDQFIGGYIDGEPTYTVTEDWSGVSNSFITPKTYESLRSQGVGYSGDAPNRVEFTERTTLGGTVGRGDDYYIQVGDEEINFTGEKDSITMSERTVIKPTPRNNVNFRARTEMERLSNGRYEIPAGKYYIVNSESLEYPLKDSPAQRALEDPSHGRDTRTNEFVGGYVDGEPTYTITEGLSGISNSFITTSTYESLKAQGVSYYAGDEPNKIEFTEKTTLGGTVTKGSDDYVQIGDNEINFTGDNDSILIADRTVI